MYASQSDPRNDNLAKSAYGPGYGLVTGGTLPANNTIPSKYSAPSPLDQIDPNSIETIEVFKGPSASALYGSDAANGVIVITTKRGRAGPTQMQLTLGQGVNWLPGSWPDNYYRFGKARDEFNIGYTLFGDPNQVYCAWYDPYCGLDSLVAFQALNDSRFSVFSHGSDQSASLSVTGGTPTLQYSLSGSAAKSVGNLKLDPSDQNLYRAAYGPIPNWMLRPDNYRTYGANGQLTAQPTPSTRVTLQSTLFNSNQQQGSLQGAISQINGEYVNVLGDTLSRQNVSPLINGADPLVTNFVERATSNSRTYTNAITAHWQQVPWLPVEATGGLSTMQRLDQTYIPYGVNSAGANAAVADTTGSYGLGRGTSEDKSASIGTTLPLRFITAAIGANYHSVSTNDFSAYTSTLAPGVTVPTQFIYADSSGPTQSNSASSTYGWYVEPRLNINSRFFISPGFRLDGGSASGGNAGLTGYPKIDLSYIAIDQSHPRGILSLLRPRLAFGYAGTQPDPTEHLRLLNVGGGQSVVVSGSSVLPSVVVSTIGNTELHPETSRELEGGFDAELWNGRLSASVTQYTKTRNNAIISVPVAPSVNASLSQFVNVGTVRNTGGEVTLNAQVFQSRALSWSLGGNYSGDKNRVVRLAPGFIPNRSLGIVAGYPLFGLWAQPIVAYGDIDHNGFIGPTEYTLADSSVFVGQNTPKYQMNFNTNITTFNGRLSVSATFAYQNGLSQNNLSAFVSNGVQVFGNKPGTSLGTQAAILAAQCGSEGQDPHSALFGCQHSDIGVIQTVNTFRFNDLSINYTLPHTLTHWLHVPRASIALQGSNLGLHTNYRGLDPDVNAFSTVNGADQTADLGQIPEPRVWWIKLNVQN
jgi:TonB-dependent SusC/RagA subfamily outer membrane receptor